MHCPGKSEVEVGSQVRDFHFVMCQTRPKGKTHEATSKVNNHVKCNPPSLPIPSSYSPSQLSNRQLITGTSFLRQFVAAPSDPRGIVPCLAELIARFVSTSRPENTHFREKELN